MLGVMSDFQKVLEEVMGEFSCETGTIHRAEGGMLHLVAHAGVPDFLLDKVAVIPFGKGIAGAAAETGEPVELCNLQQDLGGVAKEDARKTGVSGSIAVPVFSADGGVVGTLGIGKVVPYEFSEMEKARLGEISRGLSEML